MRFILLINGSDDSWRNDPPEVQERVIAGHQALTAEPGGSGQIPRRRWARRLAQRPLRASRRGRQRHRDRRALRRVEGAHRRLLRGRCGVVRRSRRVGQAHPRERRCDHRGARGLPRLGTAGGAPPRSWDSARRPRSAFSATSASPAATRNRPLGRRQHLAERCPLAATGGGADCTSCEHRRHGSSILFGAGEVHVDVDQ